jgi:hypothetical protein
MSTALDSCSISVLLAEAFPYLNHTRSGLLYTPLSPTATMRKTLPGLQLPPGV